MKIFFQKTLCLNHKALIWFLVVCLHCQSFGQELLSDSITTLLLHFNNSTKGVNGEIPLFNQNTFFSSTQSKFGQGLDATDKSAQIVYSANKSSSQEGTIEFWMKPI